MKQIIYNAQTKEVTEIEIPDEVEQVEYVPTPTLEERVTSTESNVVTIQETIDVLFGGI